MTSISMSNIRLRKKVQVLRIVIVVVTTLLPFSSRHYYYFHNHPNNNNNNCHYYYYSSVSALQLSLFQFPVKSITRTTLAYNQNTNKKSNSNNNHNKPTKLTSSIVYLAKKKSSSASSSSSGSNNGRGFGGTLKTNTNNDNNNNRKLQPSKIQSPKKSTVTSGATAAIQTQKKIEEAMHSLPQHLQIATQLYQKLKQWNAYLSTLSVLQQATSVSKAELEGASRAQDELNNILIEHNLTSHDIHTIFQRITWDASADTKASRSITGVMPLEIVQRIDKACRIAGQSVRESPTADGTTKPRRCLDVGCGYGVLVPSLMTSGGLLPSQIFGVDLSPEMIRNARKMHPKECTFDAADFIQEYHGPITKNDDGMFDSIIFCSSLHDFPDSSVALAKASTLLRRPGGTIVIVHAQGAAHVNKQVESNPVLVARGLPTANELRQLATSSLDLVLDIEPAIANTPQDRTEGYLAVLRAQ